MILALLLLAVASVGAETWHGLVVEPESRCAEYRQRDYRYSRTVERRIVEAQGAILSPYDCQRFESTRQTDIEHIVARSEAHDSGLCRADRATRRRFAGDLLNLALASPRMNRHEKRDRDAAEWAPARNRCWFAHRVVEVKMRYGLSVDAMERDALESMLVGCVDVTARCEP